MRWAIASVCVSFAWQRRTAMRMPARRSHAASSAWRWRIEWRRGSSPTAVLRVLKDVAGVVLQDRVK